MTIGAPVVIVSNITSLQFWFKHETKVKRCCTEHEVISMLEFVIGNMFVEFEGHIILTSLRHPYGNKLTILLLIFPLTLMKQGYTIMMMFHLLIIPPW